jgi:hypothetical protein
MPVHEKAALLVPSGPSHDPDRKHLHIVCCDPDGDGNVVIVGITTYTNDLCDQTCRLQAHEHPWLNHESYVLYRSAQIITAAALQGGINNGEIATRADMNAQVFLRVRNGLCNSPHTKRKVKRFMGCLPPNTA